MKVVRTIVDDPCGAGPDCPEFLETDDGGGIARGYKIPDEVRAYLSMPGNEDAVYWPPTMMNALRSALGGT
jgi:hypothetical protein